MMVKLGHYKGWVSISVSYYSNEGMVLCSQALSAYRQQLADPSISKEKESQLRVAINIIQKDEVRSKVTDEQLEPGRSPLQ